MPIAKKRFFFTVIVAVLTLVLMGLICLITAQGFFNMVNSNNNYFSDSNNMWLEWLRYLRNNGLLSQEGGLTFSSVFNISLKFYATLIISIVFALVIIVFASYAYDKTKRENRKIINIFYALAITFSVFTFLILIIFIAFATVFGIFFANFTDGSESFFLSEFLSKRTDFNLLGYPTLIDQSGYACQFLIVLLVLSVSMFLLMLSAAALSAEELKKIITSSTSEKHSAKHIKKQSQKVAKKEKLGLKK